MRLIDAHKLTDHLQMVQKRDGLWGAIDSTIMKVIDEFIRSEPTADASREIARLQKELEYYKKKTCCKCGVCLQLEANPDNCEIAGHGEWIGTEYDGYADGSPVYDVFECSICGEEFDSIDGEMHFSYCPNCGAKMKMAHVEANDEEP